MNEYKICDLYISRLGNFLPNTKLLLPHSFSEIFINEGFLGIELKGYEAYDVFVFLSKLKIASQIIPIEYKTPNISEYDAHNLAFNHFKNIFENITKNDLYTYTCNIFKWTICVSSQAINLDTEFPVAKNTISIDKVDGHIHNKKEQCTSVQESYYMELRTNYTIEMIENKIISYANGKSEMPTEQCHLRNVLIFDSLYLEIKQSNRSRLFGELGFTSNIALFFSIPKYQKGYELGIIELQSLLNIILKEIPISDAKMISNFDDDNFVFTKKDDVITFNPNWKHWI